MILQRKDDHVFLVTNRKQVAAVIHLDSRYQVDLVVLHTKDKSLRRQIKELALSHAIQYCVERTTPVFGGILQRTCQSSGRTQSESYGLMDFGLIPVDVRFLDYAELNNTLAVFVKIIEAKYSTFKRTLVAAASHVDKKHGLRVQFVYGPDLHLPFQTVVRFSSEDRGFRFWKWASSQDEIQHPDHPRRSGAKSAVAINGATEAVINERDTGIWSLIYPRGPGEMPGVFRRGLTEELVETPFFVMKIDPWTLVSNNAYRFLVNLLTAALGLQKGYVEVIG